MVNGELWLRERGKMEKWNGENERERFNGEW